MADGGLWTVARQHNNVIGPLTDGAQALNEHEHGTAFKVCTADGSLEQRVAREANALFLAIEEDAASRVAWSLDNGKAMGTELNGVLVAEQTADRWQLIADVEREELLCLLLVMGDISFVVLVDFYFQAIFIVDELVAEIMVEVTVCSKKVHRREVVLADVLLDGCLLLSIECSAVDDDTLARLIADHIAVLLKHVAHKALNVKHISFNYFDDCYAGT